MVINIKKCQIYQEKLKRSGTNSKRSSFIFRDISRSYSDKYPENQIIKSDPNSGERVEEGDTIDIVLSKGPKK